MTLVKQPAEQLRVPVAFTSALPIAAASGAVVVTARGLVAGGTALTAAADVAAGVLTLTLAGGADGERYLVSVRATDSAGELVEAELEIAVIEAAWSLPDGGRPYLSIADFIARFGLDEVVKMTDADGSGRIDRAFLTQKLADAQAEVDAHLAGRYLLPLATVPAIVALIVADLARGRLYPRGAPEGVDTAARTAATYLTRIQSGAMPLSIPGADAPASTSSNQDVLIAPGRTHYTDCFGERY